MARYIMERVAEDFGIIVSLHPKPILGAWNPTGCHTSKVLTLHDFPPDLG